jgi:hypothetical protein
MKSFLFYFLGDPFGDPLPRRRRQRSWCSTFDGESRQLKKSGKKLIYCAPFMPQGDEKVFTVTTPLYEPSPLMRRLGSLTAWLVRISWS